jgi:hypothetical protein
MVKHKSDLDHWIKGIKTFLKKISQYNVYTWHFRKKTIHPNGPFTHQFLDVKIEIVFVNRHVAFNVHTEVNTWSQKINHIMTCGRIFNVMYNI